MSFLDAIASLESVMSVGWLVRWSLFYFQMKSPLWSLVVCLLGVFHLSHVSHVFCPSFINSFRYTCSISCQHNLFCQQRKAINPPISPSYVIVSEFQHVFKLFVNFTILCTFLWILPCCAIVWRIAWISSFCDIVFEFHHVAKLWSWGVFAELF